ncbi:hypothetical protein IE4872_PD00022 (plasmid) [Rhizobium gallicum]|uniref:Uncharacterized protein n=1 Tax=Rhizobium gallicum TaxID=56730 RepID=A0A1L5NRP2_9HYPH|nr:hypothetical protein IE4872_PD00022 [Rhizobium gallicum]
MIVQPPQSGSNSGVSGRGLPTQKNGPEHAFSTVCCASFPDACGCLNRPRSIISSKRCTSLLTVEDGAKAEYPISGSDRTNIDALIGLEPPTCKFNQAITIYLASRKSFLDRDGCHKAYREA